MYIPMIVYVGAFMLVVTGTVLGFWMEENRGEN